MPVIAWGRWLRWAPFSSWYCMSSTLASAEPLNRLVNSVLLTLSMIKEECSRLRLDKERRERIGHARQWKFEKEDKQADVEKQR